MELMKLGTVSTMCRAAKKKNCAQYRIEYSSQPAVLKYFKIAIERTYNYVVVKATVLNMMQNISNRVQST
jgi:hypothetical protein